ncbi:DUF2254 domain-containing protein [Paractinoplanes globisporus]|jgi:uncharacterized membrane protein|uniref:DUF2254 domain-containing protein n=1 Tax=Paractinoplanes globisporus TaxID=113565 RepID=A0ABW6W7Y2_9ACTN|nr:DUF2254 domain-containing protein [Actinoplanes globisporus]
MDDDTADSVAPQVRRLKQRALRDRLRESLLFLPLLLLAAGVVLEEAAQLVDRHAPIGWLDSFTMAPDAAVTLLATVAGATITTAGVVFSLLVVSLQLASGQFSPRVLRTFWRDRMGQVLIGLLLATFAFCVLALSQIDTSAEHAPTLTMTCAIALALASILAIVGFLNRITRQQYVGRIMERIQLEATNLIKDLPYGTQMGQRCGEPIAAPDLPDAGAALLVRSHTDGWVQQVSHRAVLAAVPPGSTIRLETRVGSYLIRDEPLARIWPAPDAEAGRRAARLIGEAVIVGATRTMRQDIDFALRQLNDIGLRALSPAVNDPTTANEVILRVTSIMRPLLRADLPDQAQRDGDGRTLLTPWDLDHPEYVRHAYGQIRLYAGAHPQVALTLVRVLRMLRDVTAEHGDRAAAVGELDRQLAAVIADAERAGLPDSELEPLTAAAGRRQE